MRTAIFHSKLDIAKEGNKFSQYTSVAVQEDALKELRNLLPSDVNDSKDLLPFAGCAACIGLVNLNGCGMMPETAIAIKDTYLKKPVNWEHNRDRIIGYISGTAFATYPDNKLISSDEALSMNSPFNMVVSGVLWRIAGGGWDVEEVEIADNPDAPWFHDLSISWEIAFSDYVIAKNTKNLSRATILSSPEDIAKYSPYLRGEGGDGFTPQGEEVYMVITGKAMCIGIGITRNPASSVKGIVVSPPIELENDDEEEEDCCSTQKNKEKSENNLKKDEKSEKKISQASKTPVKKNKVMPKIQNKEEVFTLLTEASVDVSTQAAINNFLTEQAEAAATELNIKVKAKEDEATKLAAELADFKQKAATAEASLTTITEKVKQLEEQAAEDHRQNVLASRIDELCSKYALAEHPTVKTAVVKQIRNLSDVEYASWMKEMGEPLLTSLESKSKVDPVDATHALKEATASVTIPNAQNIEDVNDFSKLINAVKFSK